MLSGHRRLSSCACNYSGTHTLQTGTQQRCFAAEIGMVVVVPPTSSFTESSTTSYYLFMLITSELHHLSTDLENSSLYLKRYTFRLSPKKITKIGLVV